MLVRILALMLLIAGPVSAAETAIFAGGCFWCVEADFESVPGVSGVVSGYTGGTTVDPSYKEVSRGGTGHYEAVEITYDPDVIGYPALVALFFRSIDPLDRGGQFCDRGQQYATAVFVRTPGEKAAARRAKAEAGRVLGARIATKILDAAPFYRAEDYHQDYYKGTGRVLTRFGWIRQSDAYGRYRKSCGRDRRILEIWGSDAPFASGH